MFSKYIYAGLGVVILSLAAFGGYQKWQSDKKDAAVLSAQHERDQYKVLVEAKQEELNQTQKQLSAVEAASKVREEELDRLIKQKEKSDALLQKALDSNRDWADTRIPDSVREALK